MSARKQKNAEGRAVLAAMLMHSRYGILGE
jgi:hypothetical protein